MASNHIFNKTGHIDISWLPLAAEKYHISPDIKDYIINEIPIVTVDVPNRNLDAFTFDAVSAFNPDIGRIAYQTFISKPTHRDHDNKDIRKARGVHLDASLQKLANGQYKIVVLAAWDRTKDPEMIAQMLRGDRLGFSMGAFVGYTECSYPGCGATSPNGRIACSHMQHGKGKGQVVNGQLLYENCFNLNYIETSILPGVCPADHTAYDRWRSPWDKL
jgi:hypothetical protein